MDHNSLTKLLNQVRDGTTDVDTALGILNKLPYTDLGYAKIDLHRALRQGFPEVIFCLGKTTEHIVAIFQELARNSGTILATRATPDIFTAVKQAIPEVEYTELARTIVYQPQPLPKRSGRILVVSAGTADLPVAEEAAITADVMGNSVERLYDVGVSGLHRLLANLDLLQSANVLIVVAGMEGALPSIVGGLVRRPVIAVPTSVGYGASLGGLAALLGMLNSCASGVTVVNIDNGFGAGYAASLMNQIGESS